MGRRELDVAGSALSDASSPDYAPSPNTCSAALSRANQLRLQSLLRELLEPRKSANMSTINWQRQRLDTLRVLRKSLRELNFQLTWLSQVDLLETMERLVRDDHDDYLRDVSNNNNNNNNNNSNNNITIGSHLSPAESGDWRIVNEATQLLSEAIPQFTFDVDMPQLCPLLAAVIENLGHSQSEVRRSSLLLINMYINERPAHFKHLLKLFIDYGLANHRNPEAQRGAILSLPLLMTAQVVEGEDLLPLLRCLCELLVEADAQLFYSLYLALQRLHLTLGDHQFHAYLRQCDPEALLLYKQAASRSNSLALSSTTNTGDADCLAGTGAGGAAGAASGPTSSVTAGDGPGEGPSAPLLQPTEQKQVSFSHNTSSQRSLSASTTVSSEAQAAPDSPEPDSPPPATLIDERRHLSEEDELATADEYLTMDGATPIDEPAKDESPATGNGAHDQRVGGPFGQQQVGGRERQASTPRSSVSSTCSSRAHLVDPSHYMTAAALAGKPLADYEQLHKRALQDHSSTGLAINDLSACCTPTMELGPGAGHELRFGIFPRHLVAAALSAGRPGDRVEALQEMMCLIRDSPINHLAILITYFDAFLDQFLSQLLSGGQVAHNSLQPQQQQVAAAGSGDFKVALIAIDMIETIVIKSKASTLHYIRPLVALLVRALADNRSRLFRDNSARVLHKLMGFLPPQHVIDALFEHKHHRSGQVREEAVNRVSAAVLHYHRDEFNLTKLCYHVLPMLADHSGQVRLAALECIAVLAHALGQERIGSLLTAAEAVQTGADFDGLLDAIQARLQRRQLPRCNPADGLVRFVIKPFLSPNNQNFHLEHQAADVRWVLEAPSTHQHQQQQSPQPPVSAAHLSAALHQHQAHRPGAYSPPRDFAQRRCSMAVLSQELHQLQHPAEDTNTERHQHHHQHQHHPHSHHEQVASAPEAQRRRVSISAAQVSSEPLPASVPTVPQPEYSETPQAEPAAATAAAAAAAAGTGRRRNSRARQPKEGGVGGGAPEVLRHKQLPATTFQRSSSQDSSCSSDSNKVLFQYYLSKFKQSLTDPTNGTLHPVLPSDSIIYTDTAQAYALSRHQSRQQQTSFDYDSDSVGRIPDSSGTHLNHNQVRPVEHEPRPSVDTADKVSGGRARQQQQQQKQQYQRDEQVSNSSGTESPPLTVMERRASRDLRDSARNSREEEPSSHATAEAQQVVRPRRKSISGRSQEQQVSEQQQQQPSLDENTTRRKSIVAERTRRDSHASDGRAASPPAPEPVRQRRSHEEEVDTTRREPRATGSRLVRQSASCAIPVELHSASSVASTVASRASAGRSVEESAASRRSAPAEAIQHQDSLTTTNSESLRTNPPDTCSDSATQTAPHLDDGGHHDADDDQRPPEVESARRKSRRSSRRREMSSSRSHHELDLDESELVGHDDEHHRHDVELRRRASRSQPPAPRHRHLERKNSRSHTPRSGVSEATRRAVSVSPSLASSVNIRHILENVAQLEGPFQEPQLAFKVALDALDGPCWSTKVEGLLALIRLAAYHQPVIVAHLHEVVSRTVAETRNLRSTVARSAIFALGDFSAKLKRVIEPEMETIVQALLQRSSENTAFIRDDIRRAFVTMLDHLTHWRLANALIHHGANHKNMHVRRMTSQFVALLVERMGAAKCLVGARDISAQLLPATAKFAQDSSPHTRYYGRLILVQIMQHSAFERLLRKHLTPNLYRSTVGIIESVKRRGPGDPPADG